MLVTARQPLVAGLVLAGIGLPILAAGQGTAGDYARAAALRDRYESAAADIAGPPTAIAHTHRFWYRKSVTGGHQFMIVDADTREKRPAFDHDAIARALSAATGKPYSGLQLPFSSIDVDRDGPEFAVNVEGARYRCRMADASCRKLEGGRRLGAVERPREESPRPSPDGTWEG